MSRDNFELVWTYGQEFDSSTFKLNETKSFIIIPNVSRYNPKLCLIGRSYPSKCTKQDDTEH